MTWDKTAARIYREAHMAGVLDLLHALLDQFENEPHACRACEWAEHLYRDPVEFDRFVRDSQAARDYR